MSKPRVEQFLHDFARWAATRRDIQGVAPVGSYARGAATETSDVDLVVLADQPGLYLQEGSWAEKFGKSADQQVEDYGKLVSLRIKYADGLEVEYGFTEVSWAGTPLDQGTREVIQGGMKVLFERGPLFRAFPEIL
jgi:predicted nucleotidyltransferase